MQFATLAAVLTCVLFGMAHPTAVRAQDTTRVSASTIGTELSRIVLPRGLVSDFAHVFADSEVVQLEKMLRDLRARTTAEIAVVTLPTLDGQKALDIATSMGRRWGVGPTHPPEHPLYSSGMVVLLGMKDRAFAVAIGTGAERWISQARIDSLLAVAPPYFRRGAYGEGVRLIIKELIVLVEQRAALGARPKRQ